MADTAELTLRINSSQAEVAAKRTERTLERLDISAEQVGRSFQSLGLKMSAAITAPFLLTARAAVKASAEYEKARISFGVFINDMQRGAMVFDDIVQLAAKTPLNVSSLQDAAGILLATGAATADSLLPMLTDLGNISRADSNILQRLALNLGQVASQGKLTGRDLRDFAIAGVPLLNTLAKQMGKTTSEISEMVSKGTIGFDDVVKAFRAMTSEGGKFNGLMDKLSQTVSGKWTTAVDNVRLTLSTFADVFRDQIKGVLDIVIRVATWFRSLAPEVKRVIGIVAGIAAAVGPALLILGGIITSVAAVKASFVFLGIALAPALVILVKIGAVIGAIAVAVEGLRRAFGLTWADIGQGLLDFGMKAIGFVVNFRANWNLLTTWIKNNWENMIVDLLANIVIFHKNLFDNFKIAFNLIGGLIGVFGGWFLDSWQDILNSVVNKVIEWAADLVMWFSEIGKKIIKAIKNGMSGESIEIDFLDRLVKGAARTGTLKERINAELAGVDFVPFARGFQRSTESLPDFVTDLGSLFGEQVARSVTSASLVPEEVKQDASQSTKLSGAFEAGSSEAFKLLTNREDKTEKTQRKNLSANQSTAFNVERLATDGIKLNGIQSVGSIR